MVLAVHVLLKVNLYPQLSLCNMFPFLGWKIFHFENNFQNYALSAIVFFFFLRVDGGIN